ncbi:MAG: hypothetical protein ACTSRB_16180 [Candidatus Helarchaeota archaeon]
MGTPCQKSYKLKTGKWFHHPDFKKPINANVNSLKNIALKYHYIT